jgi:hypothetical protein
MDGEDRERRDGEQGAGSREERQAGTPYSDEAGSFGSGRGDAGINEDLESIEDEDESLTAGGREDVSESESEDVDDVGGYRAGRREEESDLSSQGERDADSEQVTWPGRRRE